MDGTVPGLQGVEYVCGGAVREGNEDGGSGGDCPEKRHLKKMEMKNFHAMEGSGVCELDS